MGHGGEKKKSFPCWESTGKEAVEEPQKPNLKPLPTKLDPSAIVQATNSPLPAEPFPDQVRILAKPVAHETHGTPTAKAIPSALHVQYFRKLVAYVQNFATTSNKLATAHTAWHSGWLLLLVHIWSTWTSAIPPAPPIPPTPPDKA